MNLILLTFLYQLILLHFLILIKKIIDKLEEPRASFSDRDY